MTLTEDPRGMCLGEGICDASGACAEGEYVFGSLYGGTQGDDGLGLAIDSAGAWLIVGGSVGPWAFGEDINTESGGIDFFVGKLDAAGQPLWNYRFGGMETDYLRTVAVDAADAIYVGGYVDGQTSAFSSQGPIGQAGERTAAVGKLSSEGDEDWLAGFGFASSDDQVFSVAVDDGDGSVVAVGRRQGLFMAKLDADDGTTLAISDFSSSAFDHRIMDVAIAPDGAVAITGQVQGDVDFGGGMISTGASLAIFVAVFDRWNGQPAIEDTYRWADVFPGVATGLGRRVVFEADGGVTICGDVQGSSADFGGDAHPLAGGLDAFVARFAADGTYRGSATFGAAGDQVAAGMALDEHGNFGLAGWFQGELGLGGLTSNGGDDAFAVKLTPELELLWARKFGDGANQFARQAAYTGDGFVLLGAAAGSLAVPNGGTASAAGDIDFMVLRLSQ